MIFFVWAVLVISLNLRCQPLSTPLKLGYLAHVRFSVPKGVTKADKKIEVDIYGLETSYIDILIPRKCVGVLGMILHE